MNASETLSPFHFVNKSFCARRRLSLQLNYYLRCSNKQTFIEVERRKNFFFELCLCNKSPNKNLYVREIDNKNPTVIYQFFLEKQNNFLF
jgi:hypothetical protein